jgi:hypothetical protein
MLKYREGPENKIFLKVVGQIVGLFKGGLAILSIFSFRVVGMDEVSVNFDVFHQFQGH